MDGFNVTSGSKFIQNGNSIESGSLSIKGPKGTTESQGASFADTLKDAVNQVNSLQKASDKSIQDLTTGKTDDVAGVMIASEKADVALRVMVQVRNKIIDAYNEIMKMQV